MSKIWLIYGLRDKRVGGRERKGERERERVEEEKVQAEIGERDARKR
jgi:hypothetical protein